MLATCWYVADLELITVPFIIESMLHFTSFAVTGRPSWKRTPCRRWKIYVSGLGISQLWATHGCRTKCSSLRIRVRPGAANRSECGESKRANQREDWPMSSHIPARGLSGITDFAENRGISRARCGGNIPGLAMPCLIREQRESNGFLRLTRHAKIVRCAYSEPQRLNFIGDHAH